MYITVTFLLNSSIVHDIKLIKFVWTFHNLCISTLCGAFSEARIVLLRRYQLLHRQCSQSSCEVITKVVLILLIITVMVFFVLSLKNTSPLAVEDSGILTKYKMLLNIKATHQRIKNIKYIGNNLIYWHQRDLNHGLLALKSNALVAGYFENVEGR